LEKAAKYRMMISATGTSVRTESMGWKSGFLEDHPERRKKDNPGEGKDQAEYEKVPRLEQVSRAGLMKQKFFWTQSYHRFGAPRGDCAKTPD
jgi:hypothetical protein